MRKKLITIGKSDGIIIDKVMKEITGIGVEGKEEVDIKLSKGKIVITKAKQ